MDMFHGHAPISDEAKDGKPHVLSNPETGDIGLGYWTGDMFAEFHGEEDGAVQLSFEPTHYLPNDAARAAPATERALKQPLSLRLFEANLRVEGIWPIPNGEVPEAMLEAFEFEEDRLKPKLTDFTRGWSEDEIEALFGGDDCLAREAWSELYSNLHNENRMLYVMLASNPVFTPGKSGGCSFSWGHYQSEVFIAKSVDDCMEEALAWADARYAEVRAEAQELRRAAEAESA